MIKNIIVVDEFGNEYEATYPKRAKGLVKKGRARFVGDNKICLVCPLKNNMEDKIMLNDYNAQRKEELNKQIDEALLNDENADINQIIRNWIAECDEKPEGSTKLTIDYALEQIEKISNQTDYLNNTIGALSAISNSNGPEDFAGKAKGQALGDLVKCRETTNQQLLKFYEKMYDDLKPQKSVKA